jgi:predicted ABC-type transport system involved in lysophospholipase L1 biosynthesis ATPase subunit
MSAAPPSPLLQVQDLVKDYQSLRPLRMRALTVAPGDSVTISGLDALGAEVFVHLVTGATLPDAGEIHLFGTNTRAVTDGDAWLASLEGMALVSARAVLIEMFTALQNIAMPFTLDVDPVDARYLPQVGALAREVGLDPGVFDVPVGKLGPDAVMRTHLARALALGPKLLVAEHPSATLPRDTVAGFGQDLARVARARGLGLVTLTADETFAKALGGQRLALNGATGELRTPSLMQRLFK